MRTFLISLALGACVLSASLPARSQDAGALPPGAVGMRAPDVIFVPTPKRVIDAMLTLAAVTKNDIVYDLGCGDGRIVVAAARKGARSVGIDIDPQRVREANENIRKAGVARRAQVIQADLFEADIREATVVTLYLLNSLNEKLKPKLLAELAPGTRVVSHGFHMGDWKPEKTRDIGGNTIYLWRVPQRQ